mgnify:FL=1
MGQCSSKNTPEAVLWDLDGTLIDTSRQSLSALQAAMVSLLGKQYKVDTSVLLPIISGDSSNAAQDMLAFEKKDKLGWAADVLKEIGAGNNNNNNNNNKTKVTPKQLVEEWEVHMLRNRRNISLMPGALEVVEHFAKHNVPQCIATMSNSKSVSMKRTKHENIFKHMKTIVCSDDPHVKKRKPAPDVYIVAAERMGVKPTGCIVIEDSPEGCRAGWAAGARVVSVADAWSSDSKIGKGVRVFSACSTLLDIDFKKLGLPPLEKKKEI